MIIILTIVIVVMIIIIIITTIIIVVSTGRLPDLTMQRAEPLPNRLATSRKYSYY